MYLSHEIIATEHSRKFFFFLHGFLGTKANWRSFAKKFVGADNNNGAVLVDLRLHGQSLDMPPPHTISSAADDLVVLANYLNISLYGVVGHSFGAKVALSLIERMHKLREAWLIDAVPWALNAQKSALAYSILSIFENLKNRRFSSRKDFESILESNDISKKMAQWLSMNLAYEHSYYLKLNVPNLKGLVDDYYAQDLLFLLEKAAALKIHVHFVLAGQSEILQEHDRARILTIAQKYPHHIHSSIIKNAGHNIHIDAPEQLLYLFKS
jgi:pimeloyl-ACP methyl ester carboxylesterase